MGKKTSITATGVIKALEALRADPAKTLNITNAVPNPKMHGSATFRQCRWNVGGKPIDGMFIGRDIMLDNDICDPKNREDARSKYESMRLRLESTVSKSGPTGEFISAAVDRFTADVNARIASGDIVPMEGKDGKNLNTPLNRSYINKKTKEVMVKDDPTIRWELDFGNYPDKFYIDSMQGTPVTQFFDATKPKDAAGTEFEPLLYEGAPVTKDNIHMVVTPDSIIRRLHFTMNSVAISDKGISLKCVANKIVLEVIKKSGVSDDDDDVPLAVAGRPVPPIVVPAASTPTSTSTASTSASTSASTDASVPATASTSTSTDASVPATAPTDVSASTASNSTVPADTADLDASLNALLGTV